ncbi:MAG: helix-hairpin-helix domain-containing protein, partial [Saprospiraceae bacterium]
RALLAAKRQPNIAVSELFVFDPNTVSYDDLLLLGLSARTARSIENYRNKGGKFRRPEDFQRIYTLSEEEYARLRPFIRIGAQQRDYADKSAFFSEKKARQKRSVEYFEFDPNTASASDFARLGLPEWLGARIEKYRDKGGVFRKPEDFAKIYGMRPEDFERLAPYLRIAPKERQVAYQPAEDPRPVMASGGESMGKSGGGGPVDVNEAQIDDWVRLPGIGAVRAEKIIRFREKLGGFAEIEQVAETYGLPDSIYRQIRPMLVMGGAPLRKLNINTADVAALSAHPYLTRKQAELIVAFREQHGPYASTQDIFNILALKREEIARAMPYLSVN